MSLTWQFKKIGTVIQAKYENNLSQNYDPAKTE
jgi:hypothetical protein